MLEKNKVYNLSEFCRVLRESQQTKQEFNPKKGDGVEKENKKNNGEVEKIIKQTEKYDGGVHDKEKKKEDPRDAKDFNKDMLGWRYTIPPNDQFVKDTKARVEGFASDKNKQNSKIKDENKGLDFEGNEEYLKDRKEIEKERFKTKVARELRGLATSKENEQNNGETKDRIERRNGTVLNKVNENKKMKRLHFNKTVFLNEEQMLKKIPDDMKINGNKFYMKDSVGNEYLVECVKDKVIDDVIHTNVVDYVNKEKINETFNRMKELYDYKSSNERTNVNENKMVGKMISESKDKLISKTEDPKDRFFKTLVGNQ